MMEMILALLVIMHLWVFFFWFILKETCRQIKCIGKELTDLQKDSSILYVKKIEESSVGGTFIPSIPLPLFKKILFIYF